MNGAKPFGAPTRFYRLPNTETASDTDSVLVEGPDMSGDQMVWCVYNDLDPDNHAGATDAGNTDPMGVEIQQTTFGFNRLGPLGNTVFLRFKILNKGGNQLDDMYVSVGEVPETRVGKLAQEQWRAWTLPLTEADMPVTTAVNGSGGRTCQDIVAEFDTCADLLAVYGTSEDLLLDRRTG